MPIIGWIRDLFGIQKDMYETKKTRLEIEKIEDEKREKLITLATLDDVEQYDPNTRKLLDKIFESYRRTKGVVDYDEITHSYRIVHRRLHRRRIIIPSYL